MIERTYRFGKRDCLVGIVTETDRRTNNEMGPGVLMLNAGLLHRVGPHRLHVDLGRRLALQGFNVLRFDISGIGDSEMRGDKLPYEKRAIADIRDAMDFMESKWHLDRFVLMGLCSGAEHAHVAAVEDERVCGAVLLDGYGYRTGRFYAHRILERCSHLLSARKWRNLLRQGMKRSWRRGAVFNRDFPARESAETDLMKLLKRGVGLLFVYTGDARTYYNYTEQFRDMFTRIERQDGVKVEYLKEVDHTFTLLEDRGRLMSLICEWMACRYGSSQAGDRRETTDPGNRGKDVQA